MSTPAGRDIGALLELMRRLRDPDGGCPWDQEQSYASIVPHTLEEAYEVADAIARGDMPELRDELGDLLFQVVFYARLGEEDGHFDFGDVVEAVVDKLVRRHPHVFGNAQVEDAAAQTVAWEGLKAEERANKAAQGVLDGVSLALPALTRAGKLQKRAARIGFDWPDVNGVRAKLDEELAEFDAERAPHDGAAVEEVGAALEGVGGDRSRRPALAGAYAGTSATTNAVRMSPERQNAIFWLHRAWRCLKSVME